MRRPLAEFAFAVITLSVSLACRSGSSTGLETDATPSDAPGSNCALREFPVFGRPQRVAVLGPDEAADPLILALSHDSRFRLVERSRLQAVLNEQKLNNAGFTSPAQEGEHAVKLGGLLPLDLLLVARRHEGQIRGRFLDVVSGEIVSAFACPAGSQNQAIPNVTNNQTTTNSQNTNSVLNSTINSNNTTVTNSNNTTIHIDHLVVSNSGDVAARKCDSLHKPVLDKFSNLNGQDHLDAAVAAAVRIPFDMDCGTIHFDIIYTLKRYQLFPASYSRFLIRTLNGIDQPSEDSRATTILAFFAESNGGIEGDEWQVGLSLLERAREGTAAQAMIHLINLRRETAPALRRADTILSLAESGRIGRPVAFHPAVVFRQIVEALRPRDQEHAAPLIAFLNKHGDRYARSPDRPLAYKSMVKAIMQTTLILTSSPDRRSLYSLIGLFYANPEGQDKQKDAQHFYDQLFYDLVYPLQNAKKEMQLELDRRALEADEAFMRETLRVPLCQTPEFWRPGGYSRKEMISYLLVNGMSCPNLPTVATLNQQLLEGDWATKVDATDFLRKMGAHAAPAEASAIKYYMIDGMSRSSEIRANCAEILGNVGTRNPVAIRALVQGLGDFDTSVQHQSEVAVQKLGGTAVPFLIEFLNRTHGITHESRRRVVAVEILGRLGSVSRPALPLLLRLASSDVDSYMRSRANVAAVNVQEGRAE